MKETGVCLSEPDLNDYLSGALPCGRRAEVEAHLADCSACMEKLAFAYSTLKEFAKAETKGVDRMKTGWKRNLWLFGAVLSFVLSFFVARYFVQLLVATILMAAKWIFDSVNARILIMIYDAWNKGGEARASEVLRSLTNRFRG